MVLQAQVLAMMGQTKEAEKMTNHIVSEDTGCLECYRLLSAIYSKQEQHDKVERTLEFLGFMGRRWGPPKWAPGCRVTRLSCLEYHQLAYPILWVLFTDIPLTLKISTP